MLNIYLCDDEKKITAEAADFIKEYFMDFPCEYHMEIYNSGKMLLKKIMEEKNVDVLFLDIDLTDSNGIQVARLIRKFNKKIKIVFMTNYKNYKGAAFSVRAFGYIEKPLTKEQIFNQLSDIQKYILDEKKDISIKFETVEGLVNIEIKDILYFESFNRKVKIVTNYNTYIMAQKISSLKKMMEQYNFKSPHSSFLVNLDYIADIKNYVIYMINGSEIPLSQRKSREFRQAMDDFLEQTVNLCKGEHHV